MVDEFLFIAKIQSAGKHGFVKVQLVPGFFNGLKNIKYFFLDFWNQKKHFELEDIVTNKSTVFFKFKNFNDERDISVLLDREIYISKNELNNFNLDDIKSKDVNGFKVFKDQDFIGIVSDFYESPANSVIELKSISGKEILIPFVESIVVKVDYDKKELLVNPDFGLDDDED